MAETTGEPSAARQRIDAFLTTLSAYDLIYLRSKFRSGQIPIMGLASLPDLPVEILCLVVPWLSLEDVLSCLLVNRAWYASWSQGAIMRAVGRFFFPGLIEKHKLLRDGQSTRDLVHSSLIRSMRRRHGQPHRVSFVSWNKFNCPVFHRSYQKKTDTLNDCISDINENAIEHHENGEAVDGIRPDLYPRPFYDKGRLAWQPSSVNIIIDDLRTCERRECNLMEMYLQAQKLVLHAMSRELLVFVVMATPYCKTIHIWHIDLQAWKRVTLPGPLVTCFVEGERAAFVIRQGSVIAWSWSNGTSEIDVSGAMSRPPVDYEGSGVLPGVILHPNMTDTLYVASLYLGKRKDSNSSEPSRVKSRPRLMSVVRYEGGQSVEEFRECIHNGWDYESWTDGLLCAKLGSNGLYDVASLHRGADYHYPYMADLPSVGFNIYTESFVQHMWGEYNSNFASSYPETCFYPWEGITQSDELAPKWFIEHANRRRCLARGVGVNSDLAEDRVPSYSRKLARYVPSQEWDRMCEDDDFEIYISTGGILVFSFTRDTALPSLHGSSAAIA